MATVTEGRVPLKKYLEAAAGFWLVALPLLRPLIWNGDASNLPNLFYLALLSTATVTGLILRTLDQDISLRRPWALGFGLFFMLWAGLGCLVSPLPSQAWLLWLGWSLHLAAPLALLPVIRRRPDLLLAGLCAGLGLELLLMVGQVLWERPALQRNLAEDPALVPQESMRGQYTVRVHSWRLEGTFLLANTLATYLAMLWPLLAVAAWRAWATRELFIRWFATTLLVACTVGLALTGSKAGILAWALALAVTAALVRPRWRWPALVTVFILVALAWSVPALREKARASFAERWGYWRGAVALAAERPVMGWGLEGYAVHFSRVKPPETEPTVCVHNETLQAACDLGLVGAGVLLAWWLAVLYALRPTDISPKLFPRENPFDVEKPPGTTSAAFIDVRVSSAQTSNAAFRFTSANFFLPVAAGALVAVTLLAIGALNPNLRTYPLGIELWWLWAWGLVFIAGILVHCALRLPRPSAVAAFAGVLACLLHAQADFHLHSMQVVGILAWLAVLGLALREGQVETKPVSSRRETAWSLVGLIVVLLGPALMAWGIFRTNLKDSGQELSEAMRRTLLWHDQGGNERRQEAVTRLNQIFKNTGYPSLAEDDPRPEMSAAMAELAGRNLDELLVWAKRWPADADLAHLASDLLSLLHQLRPDLIPALTPLMRDLAARWPDQPFALQGLAWHLRRLAEIQPAQARERREEAVLWLRRAVALSPGYLPLREQIVDLAQVLGDRETVRQESAALHRLAPLVHETGRANRTW